MKDLFLCHAGADKAWVHELGTRLEAERIGNRFIQVFIDDWDIDHGENIVSKIDHALKTARFCAVVLSPAMLKRDWPHAEWTAVFMSDPAGRRQQLLPILLHDRDADTGELIDIPMLLRPLRRYDFTRPSNYEVEFSELLRRLRGERPRRGGWRPDSVAPMSGAVAGAEVPDDVQEMLVSNLLPVNALPTLVWSDIATTEKKTDIWKSITGERVPPFVLEKGRLYSFVAGGEPNNPFRDFMAGSEVRSEPTTDWLANPDRSRLIMRLLNDALQEHAFHLRIRNLKDNRRQFYCPIFDGKPRIFRWGGGGRHRTIAKVAARSDSSTIGIHYSAKLRFILLGSAVHLLVEPGWMFTSDGVVPLEGKQVTVLSTKFGGRERNASVLRNVLMWAMLLADGQERIRIATGGYDVIVDLMPALAGAAVGIDGDTMKLDRILADGVGGEVRPGSDAGDEDLDEALLAVATGMTAEEGELEDTEDEVAE